MIRALQRIRQLVGVSLVLAVTTWGCDHVGSQKPDGPVPDGESGARVVSGLVGNEGLDWGEEALQNTSTDTATIEWVRLVSGGGSEHDFLAPEFFIAGPERELSGGATNPRNSERWWGTTLQPAVGYVLPGVDEPRALEWGSLLVIRLRMNGLPDASFDGVEVGYEWQGEHYIFHSLNSILLCSGKAGKPMPEPCRHAE